MRFEQRMFVRAIFLITSHLSSVLQKCYIFVIMICNNGMKEMKQVTNFLTGNLEERY